MKKAQRHMNGTQDDGVKLLRTIGNSLFSQDSIGQGSLINGEYRADNYFRGFAHNTKFEDETQFTFYAFNL